MRLAIGALLLICLQACGGGGGGGDTPTPPPASTNQNPCSTVSVTGFAAPADQARQARKRRQVDGGSRYNVLNELSLHKQRSMDAAAGPFRRCGAVRTRCRRHW